MYNAILLVWESEELNSTPINGSGHSETLAFLQICQSFFTVKYCQWLLCYYKRWAGRKVSCTGLGPTLLRIAAFYPSRIHNEAHSQIQWRVKELPHKFDSTFLKWFYHKIKIGSQGHEVNHLKTASRGWNTVLTQQQMTGQLDMQRLCNICLQGPEENHEKPQFIKLVFRQKFTSYRRIPTLTHSMKHSLPWYDQ